MGALAIVGTPSACMFLGGLCAAYFDLSPAAQARLQNVSAGILIAGVADLITEMDPDALRAAGGRPALGIVIGFVLSGAMLFGLKWLVEEMDGDADGGGQLGPASRAPRPLDPAAVEELERRLQRLEDAAVRAEKGGDNLDDFAFRLLDATAFLKHSVGRNAPVPVVEARSPLGKRVGTTAAQVERAAKRVAGVMGGAAGVGGGEAGGRGWHGWRQTVKAAGLAAAGRGEGPGDADPGGWAAYLPLIPWSGATAVLIDAASDGFLIGVASVASMRAAVVLALGCSVEMGFVGWAFCGTLSRRLPLLIRLLLAASAPAALLTCGALGARFGEPLRQRPTCFAGLMAFGLASITFLVTQELLPKAHTNQPEGRQWHVDAWLFVGMAGVLVLDICLPD